MGKQKKFVDVWTDLWTVCTININNKTHQHQKITCRKEKLNIYMRFIHPSMFLCLSEVRSWQQQAQHWAPGLLLPSNAFQFLLGDPKVLPVQAGIIPPTSPETTPLAKMDTYGTPLSWGVRKASWSGAWTTTVGAFWHQTAAQFQTPSRCPSS